MALYSVNKMKLMK